MALNPAHKEGQHKARLFKTILGFEKADWQKLEQIIRDVRGMHNSLAQSIGPHEDWGKFIIGMQLVRLIDPGYEMAQHSLAIAYLNYGVQEAQQ